MEIKETNLTPNKSFGNYSMFIGIILVIIGATGAILPEFMALEAVTFIAFFMLIAAGAWVMHTYKYARTSVKEWLKPILLLGFGIYLISKPVIGIASLGLILSFYLMMDAFASFILAQRRYPEKGWGWMVFNGVFSVILASLFLIGWPATSIWLVGLYIAINLFFNGLSLTMIGWGIKKSVV